MKKGQWNWTKDCENAVDWLKKRNRLASNTRAFRPERKFSLGDGCVGIRISRDIIAPIQRRVRETNSIRVENHCNIREEQSDNRQRAAAIIFGFRKFYNYIYGHQIKLKTDNKPLTYIYNPNKEIPLTAASRPQRWAYFLSSFRYTVEHVNTKQNGNCNALSRHPINDEMPVFEGPFMNINMIETEIETIDSAKVAKETGRDEVLRKIIMYLREGWPLDKNKLSDNEKIFHQKKKELHIEKGCILWGFRIVVPKTLQEAVLTELHASHLGIVKMKMIAQSYFWWPQLDQQIENVSNSCIICTQQRKKTVESIADTVAMARKRMVANTQRFPGPIPRK